MPIQSAQASQAMQPVLQCFNYSVDYLVEQVADVPPEDMAAQPGQLKNHPSWIIGHLTFACHLLGTVIGAQPWLPDEWLRCFTTGSVPVADFSLYEPKKEAIARLRDAQSKLTRAIEQLDDARLDAPFPESGLGKYFPTIRQAFTQVLAGHIAYHVGQLSMWRKAMGLPPMKRVFE